MYKYEYHLFNERLRNIDPQSLELTKDEKKMIINECRMNYKYFLNVIIFKNKKDSLLYKIYNKLI